MSAPRFLIARLSAMGDCVCSLPAASALKTAFPGCHVTWAVDPRFAAVVRACRSVDEVLEVRPSVGQLPRIPGSFDAALDLQGLLKSGLVVGLAKAKVKVGYYWQREGSRLFSSAVSPDPTSWHIVDQYVDVARAVGGVADRADFAMVPAEADVLSVRLKLKQHGVVGRFLAVNAGAGWVTKRWPAASFAQLIERVDLPVVLLGGKADRPVAEEVASLCSVRPANLAGETSVGELIALIRLASAHVGGDTGSTHLAAAMDVPAIGLYSITRPARSCPYGQIDRCLYNPGGLGQIEADSVLEQVHRAIADG